MSGKFCKCGQRLYPERPQRIDEIKARLESVEPARKWTFNREFPMFVGTTNAVEMYHGHLDLGRSPTEYYPYRDETGSGYRLTESSQRGRARIEALGQFLESCREDIAYLIGLIEDMEQRYTDDGSER